MWFNKPVPLPVIVPPPPVDHTLEYVGAALLAAGVSYLAYRYFTRKANNTSTTPAPESKVKGTLEYE
jgi:hypothetical protein